MQTPADYHSAALRARGSGDFLTCYDISARGLERFPGSADLAYTLVLSLTDLGNIEAALDRYESFPQLLHAHTEDWLALRGRLYKELALGRRDEAAAWFRRSAQSYRAAYEVTGQSYSAINAATMSLMAGDRDEARRLAGEVLERLPRSPPTPERDAYYHHVTTAEAALILGRESLVISALDATADLNSRDAVARARTLAQLRSICQVTGTPLARIEEHLRIPEVVCLLPERYGTDEPGSPSAAAAVAAAFVTPGEISEVRLAERFVASGTPLHLVLPTDADAVLPWLAGFFDTSGLDAVARLVSAAVEVTVIPGFLAGECERAIAYARQVAVGLSRLRAQQTAAPLRLLCGRGDGSADARPARITDVDVSPQSWPAPTTTRNAVLQRRHAAMIFADMTGFSRLSEEELPIYWNRLMPRLASVIDEYGDRVLSKSTWGDALFLVMGDATSAATLAPALIGELKRTGAALGGGLALLNIRVSIHYAPLYVGQDPVTLARIYYGRSVSVTARIEPVTPPGSVYVTASLAAQLEMEGGRSFQLAYAGQVELAKAHGARRMFSLRAAAGALTWPSPAPARKPFEIGCAGSLLLTIEQKHWLREVLVCEVFPALLAYSNGAAEVRLNAGLAPGADLLLMESALEWLEARGIAVQTRGVLPVPPDVLISDWNQSAARNHWPNIESETRASWSSMQSRLGRCNSIVSLWPEGADAADFATSSFRQRQYRRLGAYLVQHCDVLVAIHHPSTRRAPGGTGEVVEWWRNPAKVPSALGGQSRRGPALGLIVVDPVDRSVVSQPLAS